MSTITKERAQEIFLGNGPEPTASEERELARIALASLEAEPVAWTTGRYSQNIGYSFGEKAHDEAPCIMSLYWDLDTFRAHTDCDATALRWLEEAIKNTGAKPLYTAPPAPIEAEPVAWRNKVTGMCGTVVMQGRSPIDCGYEPLYLAPPAPVSVPDEVLKRLLPDAEKVEFWFEHDGKILFEGVKFNDAVFEACRAAMLQGVEPVTTAYKSPEETGSSLQLRNLIRQRHAAWSQATFGDVGPIGPLKHLSKEALEAAAEPEDLSKWADMQFLLWDAQRRAGISDGEITAAMEEKLKVNMARQWPAPKDGEPRLHIKEDGNSPVIPDGWVACSERMPEEGSRVIVFRPRASESNDPPVKTATYKGGREYYHGFDCYCEPTHWMPLPAAPQQEA